MEAPTKYLPLSEQEERPGPRGRAKLETPPPSCADSRKAICGGGCLQGPGDTPAVGAGRGLRKMCPWSPSGFVSRNCREFLGASDLAAQQLSPASVTTPLGSRGPAFVPTCAGPRAPAWWQEAQPAVSTRTQLCLSVLSSARSANRPGPGGHAGA